MVFKLFYPQDRSTLKAYIDNLPEKKFMADVKIFRDKRSDNQRKWLFGCIYPIMLQALNEAGWEFTSVEQVHEFCKKKFTQDRVLNTFTGEIIDLPNSTKIMDKSVFCAYCDTIRDWCYEYLNVDIPDPIKKEYREKK